MRRDEIGRYYCSLGWVCGVRRILETRRVVYYQLLYLFRPDVSIKAAVLLCGTV
jgi:hypothetical protein